MLRILYLTDTHLAQDPQDPWMLQPYSPQCFDELYDRLPAWLEEQNIDYIIHGGDAVSRPRPEDIELAAATFSALGRPVYLCLGNHDLMSDEAADLWRMRHGGMLPAGQFNFVVHHPEADLLVLAHHWFNLQRPYYWDLTVPAVPVLADGQWRLLEAQAARCQALGRPLLLALHSQILALDHAPVGHDPLTNPPNPELLIRLRAIGRQYPCLTLTMSGHCHAHHIFPVGTFHAMTTSALGESPFEARLITVEAGRMVIDTICFRDAFELDAPYDHDKAWAQGNATDRRREIACAVQPE